MCKIQKGTKEYFLREGVGHQDKELEKGAGEEEERNSVGARKGGRGEGYLP